MIAAGGKGVSASLKGFNAGFDLASANELPEARIKSEQPATVLPETLGSAELDPLLERLRKLPPPAQSLALAGLKRVVDFQDVAYGQEYLDRLEFLHSQDEKAGGGRRDFAFTAAVAKYLANAMAYDDVIGVADLKTRSSRFARIANEMKAAGDEPIYFTEYMHPRAEELVSLLPRRLGAWVAMRPNVMARIDRVFNRGRHVQTAKLGGFLQLYALSGLRRFRRSLLRHTNETSHSRAWLALAAEHLPANYDLARGIISTRRLIKGYSDTHARGISKYDRVLSAVPLLAARDDAGEWIDRLISAALKDEDGAVLDGALKTLKSL